MKKYLMKFGVLIMLTLITTSCKKYEEGPLISLRSVEKRVKGDYQLKECSINGEITTQTLLNDTLTLRSIEILSDDNPFLLYCGSSNIHVYNTMLSSYRFSDDKKWFLLSPINWDKEENLVLINNTTSLNPFTQQDKCSFRIKKLTFNEFYIETEYNGETYRYEFEKE